MDMRHVLLSPRGRLAPDDFARGYIWLTCAMLVIHILNALGAGIVQILQLALFYPYICVFGKRLHDAGLSAWLYLAFLVGNVILGNLIQTFVLSVWSPEGHQLMREMEEIGIEEGLGAMAEFMAQHQADLTRYTMVPSLVSFLIISAVLGFIAYKMRSDPETNKHGPPTRRSAD